ncbi:hypothetical protein [Actinomadura parmotrematis]|uniref:FUSC family protein n=1 Tax=Actinomadura parmotrematis TaxID=2864039 RepID=A0ABS7G2U5_9ACTN|nr:hypothetical protein [Actinomadura parmotrematis]MBW8487038.1 hypothetical protein [Actinomadura parmotrematis]
MPQEATGDERRITGARSSTGGGTAAGVRAERRPLLRTLAPAAIVLGLAALVLGFIPPTHLLGAIAGVVGLPLSLYSQLVSTSTNERWLNVVGMVGSFVGLAFAVSHGGFTL